MIAATTTPSKGFSRPAAAAIVAGVLGASALLGRRNAPDKAHPRTRAWYKRLDKPGITPPDGVFGAVWPALESGLAAGGYRLLRQPAGATRNLALGLWLLNTGMIGGWTELFFRKHKLGASAAASGAMVASGAGYVASAARADRPAALLGVPFVAWVGFATMLAEQVWQRNTGRIQDRDPAQSAGA
ncbi:TspO/MBR family protein [Sphingomonas dokdonensis]|uniref:TspO/MBR family protein n=1 Tax=Sphingomonas dokdonensis TaxID=344880 RepID=A0A245ZEA8_9SPHN|nr:TspO/MBR family protein [Sphingomonas dokdonensis]OWK28068.1 TspO/MBR family protein [Sphingomonas dokdonensis]